MGARTLLSSEEYLHTSFPNLDFEFRDGELEERTMPDFEHGRTQALIAYFFEALRRVLSCYVCSETRMMVRNGRFLIPDIAVFWPSRPAAVPETPPLIAIEILSPDDRLSAVREKLEEYRAWEVPHVWLVDPHGKRLYTCDTGLQEVASFTVPELGVTLGPAEIFD